MPEMLEREELRKGIGEDADKVWGRTSAITCCGNFNSRLWAIRNQPTSLVGKLAMGFCTTQRAFR